MTNDRADNHSCVLVCQRGARRRYAVPRLLHEAGMLNMLYTDSTALSPLGKVASMLSWIGIYPPRISGLAGRKIQGIPTEKIFSSDRLLMPVVGKKKERDLSSVYIKRGVSGAGIIYSMYGEDFGFLESAAGQGCRILTDVFVHPRTNRIVEEESLKLTGAGARNSTAIDREDRHSRQIFRLSDILLCPSEWVADGVREFMPECADKIRVVPYGSSINPAESINAPVRGRCLFGGRAGVRKGLTYLAEAARLVREQGHDIDVRVAGLTEEDVSWMPNRSELNFLGTVPMGRMKDEFSEADVFILPSLSEGQAAVVMEAMACGCPVIATKESGVDFDPGCGISVPVKDAGAIAAAVIELVGNPVTRSSLAEGALRQSSMFTMSAWKKRLMDVVSELSETQNGNQV